MRLYFLTTIMVISFYSCASDSKSESDLSLDTVLPGSWHLVEAYRNDKKISTLEGVFFKFDTLGNVTTNITGSENQNSIEILETGFSYYESQEEKMYQAEIIARDTINLDTKVQIFDFSLLLARDIKE